MNKEKTIMLIGKEIRTRIFGLLIGLGLLRLAIIIIKFIFDIPDPRGVLEIGGFILVIVAFCLVFVVALVLIVAPFTNRGFNVEE